MTPLKLVLCSCIALILPLTTASDTSKWENKDFRCIFFCKCYVSEGKTIASCTHKSITRPPINGFPLPGGTEVADLSYNRLHVLRGRKFAQVSRKGHQMEELLVLNISHNLIQRMSTEAFYYLDNLQVLDLSHNRLKVVYPETFRNLTKLEKLYLQNHDLTSLQPYTFKGLHSLKILDLSNGKLNHINWWAFSMAEQPTLLNLQNNSLTTFHSNSIYTPTHFHFKIDLSKNPIQCNCSLQRLFEDNSFYGEDGNVNLTCEGPINLKGFHFSALYPEDFRSCQMVPPILSNIKSPVMGIVNTTTRINCQTLAGVQYKNWVAMKRLDNKTELPERFTISQSDNWVNLTISNTSQSDAGIYMCQAIERLNANKGLSRFLPVTLKVVS